MEQCLNETGLVVSSQEISLPSTSSYEANRLKDVTCINPDPYDMENCINLNKTSQDVKNPQFPLPSLLKCEVKNEMMYCQFCPYTDIDFGKLKYHTFTQHPTEAAIINLDESDHDIKFFCVKETCNFSTTVCTDYEEHLMICCPLHQTLSRKEKERLKSTLQFVSDFHDKHCFSDVTGLVEYSSTFNKTYTPENDHEQLRKHMKYSSLFSIVSGSSSLSDAQSSMVCEDVGRKKLGGLFSSVQNPVPVFIVENEHTNLIESQTNISENISMSVGKQNKNFERLIKTDPSDFHNSKSQVHTNMNSQAGKKPFSCVECGKCFKYCCEFLKHMRIHSGEKPFKCNVCDKEFTYSSQFNVHKRTHTREKPFKCNVCGNEFTNSDHLNFHKRTHTREKTFKCNVCGNEFTNSDNLNFHKRTHKGEKPFKCNVCDKEYTYSSQFIIHKRTHTGEKPFKCIVCGREFNNSSHLNVHKRTHTGEKRFKCNMCDKEFTRSSDLIIHKRTHTGEKPFKCDVCDKVFADSRNFSEHKRTHTGEKPFKCNMCDKEFTRSSDLIIHKRTHTGEKPFKCHVCDKDFAASRYLIRHEKTHNRRKPFIVKAHYAAGQILQPLF